MTEEENFFDYSVVTYNEKILFRDQHSKGSVFELWMNSFIAICWLQLFCMPSLACNCKAGYNCCCWGLFLFVLTFLFDLFIILGWLLIIDYNSGLLKLLFCESMELFPCSLLWQPMKLYHFNLVVSRFVLLGTARFYLWWGSEGSYQVHSRPHFSSHAEPP